MSKEHPSTSLGNYPMARIQERTDAVCAVLLNHLLCTFDSLGYSRCACGQRYSNFADRSFSDQHRLHVARKIAEWMEEQSDISDNQKEVGDGENLKAV